jgi:hypothetical protein
MTQEDFPAGGDRFPATRRSVIEAVRSIDAEERESALESLCAAYWKPVYKYVRLRWNRTPDAAQDLTQGFFVELLERELLDKFDAKKSRLRTYLRLCVDSFVMNEDKAGRRQKRGGNVQHVALDFSAAEEELGATVIDPAKIASPESLEEFLKRNGCAACSRLQSRNCANFALRANAKELFVCSKPTTSRATRRFPTSNFRTNMAFP